jgi:hypothetical protein
LVASRLVCRNYLAGLSEKNDLFEALKKQFNITGGLAQLALEIAKASARSIAIVGAAQSFVNSTIDNLAEFSFLTPDQAALQDMVEKAQNIYAAYYLNEKPPASFAEAINAVHNIEYQCTRAGLRHLISRALQASEFSIDPATGTLKTAGSPLSLKTFDQIGGAVEYLAAIKSRRASLDEEINLANLEFQRTKKNIEREQTNLTSPGYVVAAREYKYAADELKRLNQTRKNLDAAIRFAGISIK